MFEILKEVALRSINTLGDLRINAYTSIQLTEFLYEKLLEDLQNLSGHDFGKVINSKGLKEIKVIFHGKEFNIFNRAYRVDSSDKDVEEVLYEFACKSLN